jgi:hypothetical protein
MGISNVATATAGIFSLLTGGLLMDVVNRTFEYGLGPRAALGLAVAYFAIGGLLLRPVDPRPREVRLAAAATG